MTEQEIIERIRATTDDHVLTVELQRNCAIQDYLNIMLEGRREAMADYLNSSPLFLPEDFVEEVKQANLSSALQIEKRLTQLKRIEAALTQQLEKSR